MRSTASYGNRIPYIDIAKGVAIICVVFGHVVNDGFTKQLVYSFHMPLFFLLSGLTYHYKEDKKKYWTSKVKHLMLPYYIFSLLSIILYCVFGKLVKNGDFDLASCIKGMLYANSYSGNMQWNRPLWFIPCMFATLLIIDVFEYFIVHRAMPDHKIKRYRIVFCVVTLLIGTIITVFFKEVSLPFHFETAIIASLFFQVGIIIKEANVCDAVACKDTYFVFTAIILGIIAVIALSYINGYTTLRGHNLGMYPLHFIATSFIGSFFVLAFSIKCKAGGHCRKSAR